MKEPAPARRPRESLRGLLRSVFRNGSRVLRLGAHVPVSLVCGVSSGMDYLYFDSSLKPADKLRAYLAVAP